LCSITASIGSQFGSFGKGGSDFWISRQVFAAKLGVIDLAGHRAGAQDVAFAGPSLGCQIEQPVTPP